MRKIVIYNRKGGVGKSTISYNLGASYILKGKKVLFLDLDDQGNLTDLMRCKPITLEQWKNLEIVQVNSNLSILPCTKAFNRLEDEINSLFDRNSYFKDEILPRLEGLADYLIVDTGPNLSLRNINSLTIADKVLVPVKPDSFSLSGLSEMKKIIEQVRQVNPGLKMEIVLNESMKNSNLTEISIQVIEKDPNYSGVEIPYRQHFKNQIAIKKPAIDNQEILEKFEELQGVLNG